MIHDIVLAVYTINCTQSVRASTRYSSRRKANRRSVGCLGCRSGVWRERAGCMYEGSVSLPQLPDLPWNSSIPCVWAQQPHLREYVSRRYDHNCVHPTYRPSAPVQRIHPYQRRQQPHQPMPTLSMMPTKKLQIRTLQTRSH